MASVQAVGVLRFLFCTWALLPVAVFGTTSSYVVDWAALTNPSQTSRGDGTYYGDGQDYQGACSYGTNFAKANGEPWGTGAEVTIAMNDYQFANSGICGACIMFRGAGGDKPNMGTPAGKLLQDKVWHKAHVTNKCPECAPGDIDLCKDGDGRWLQEWYAIPCDVGTSKIRYHFPVYTAYWQSMVITNHRIPIRDVAIKWAGNGDNWIALPRTVNNQWPYYNTYGAVSWPMEVRVTSVSGEVVIDSIASIAGGWGTKQFGDSDASVKTSDTAVPVTTRASTPDPTPAATSAASTGSVSVASVNTVDVGGQCGGKGGFCKDSGCVDEQFPGATCTAPYKCVRFNEWWWGCEPEGAGSRGAGNGGGAN